MFSVNIPIGGDVKRVIAGLHPELVAFEEIRDQHTLVCKRFEQDTVDIDALETQLRLTLRGLEPFRVKIDGIEMFEDPVAGRSPVIYLSVESAELMQVHMALADAFGPVPELEGESYVPHITIARGGPKAAAVALMDREIESVSWMVNEIWIWDAKYRERVQSISLPV